MLVNQQTVEHSDASAKGEHVLFQLVKGALGSLDGLLGLGELVNTEVHLGFGQVHLGLGQRGVLSTCCLTRNSLKRLGGLQDPLLSSSPVLLQHVAGRVHGKGFLSHRFPPPWLSQRHLTG